MSRWQLFRISEEEAARRLRHLGHREAHAFVPLPALLISLSEREAEIQLPSGHRHSIPTRALRNNMGTIAFSREALRQRGISI